MVLGRLGFGGRILGIVLLGERSEVPCRRVSSSHGMLPLWTGFGQALRSEGYRVESRLRRPPRLG